MNFDRPIMPLMSYDPNTPPVVFDVKVPEQAKYIIPLVVSAICNEATAKANTRPVRMFTYNLLSHNCWNNNEMLEVVNLAVNYCILQVNKNFYNRLDFAIPDCVREILALYTSTVMFQNSAVKAASSPQDIATANENAQVFNNLKGEIHNMMNGLIMNNPGYSQNVNVGPGIVNQNVVAQMQNYNNNNTVDNNQFPPVQRNTFAGGNSHAVNSASLTARTVDSDDRYSHRQNRQQILNQSNFINEPVNNVNKPVVQANNTNNNVSANKNNIAYINEINLSSNSNDIFHYSPLILSTCLSDLINNVKIALKTKRSWSEFSDDFITANGDVITCVIQETYVKRIISELSKCSNFYTMCRLLKRIKTDAADMLRSGTVEEGYALTATVEEISSFFINKINNYLKYELGTGVVITDFLDDAPDLAKYFETKYNENIYSHNVLSRFNNFESNVFNSVFTDDDVYTANAFDAVGVDYSKFVSEDESAEPPTYDFDPQIGILRISYMLTITKLFSEQIDIPNKNVIFKLDENSILYKQLLNTIINCENQVVVFILVTRDNVKYKFWISSETNEIYIVKV